jgi:hypothetical protein
MSNENRRDFLKKTALVPALAALPTIDFPLDPRLIGSKLAKPLEQGVLNGNLSLSTKSETIPDPSHFTIPKKF